MKEHIPIHQDFKPSDIADKIYPHLIRQTKSGGVFNLGCATIARRLRKMRGILEVSHGVFWADESIMDDTQKLV